jgi:uncharacterized membrane protein YadS
MSILIPLMAILYRRGEQRTTGTKKVRQPWHQILPLFVVGFFLMACIRSLGDMSADKAFGFIPHANWKNLDAVAKFYAPWCLATALGAVGLGTGLAKLRSLGFKPFSVGLAAALLVGGVSIALIEALTALGFMGK